MSIFSEAFSKAGIDTDAARLAVVASNLLARADLSPMKAMARFVEIVEADKGLFRALASDYLNRRAADMRGESLNGGAIGLMREERHDLVALVGQSVGDDGGQSRIAIATRSVPSSLPKNADREGQIRRASAGKALPSRSAPLHDGKGQFRDASQHEVASPVVKPPQDPRPYLPKPVPASAIRARLAAAQMAATSILDTYKVRGGIAIGDLSWAEAKTIARTNEREARVLRYITDHVVNIRPGAIIRDVVKPEIIENAIRLAQEAENVAA